jgi:hypothetical protein
LREKSLLLWLEGAGDDSLRKTREFFLGKIKTFPEPSDKHGTAVVAQFFH